MEPLVQAIATALLPHLDKPFALFGHSMGAIVSFELARLLRQNYGISPVYLFVSGRRAPQIPHPKPPTYNLPEPAFLAELRRLNGTPKAVLENAELLQLLLPIVRADFEALETYFYQAQPPLECPIAAFGGLSDTETNIDNLEAWANQTTAAFSLQMLPGDHFFLHSAQSQLLQYLICALAL
jgi:medium-chain acyl-[acyl-carrier-protein] hydrolase